LFSELRVFALESSYRLVLVIDLPFQRKNNHIGARTARIHVGSEDNLRSKSERRSVCRIRAGSSPVATMMHLLLEIVLSIG
jgi:hypothetical protein